MSQRLGTTVEFLTGETNDPSPHYYTISKSEAELYALITKIRGSDTATLKRLMFYFEELQKEK